MKAQWSLSFKAFLLLSVMLVIFLFMFSCGSKSANLLMVNNNTKASDFTPSTVLSSVQGSVLILREGNADWTPGEEGMILDNGTQIKTGEGAKATVTFFDGSTVDLDNDTGISIEELKPKSSSSASKAIKLKQEIGETTSRVVKLIDPASRYEVQTDAGVAAVRGSIMVVAVDEDGTTRVYNVEGSISLTAQGKAVAIPAGTSSSAKVSEIPTAPEPGLPPSISPSNTTSISGQAGWQQTGLSLNKGDNFYVEYRGGSWTVDYRNFPYVGLAGYADDIDKKIAAGYKFDSALPYGFLLGKVGDGKVVQIGTSGGPFTADTSGYLFLRINDKDSSLGDNDGAVSVSFKFDQSKEQPITSKSYNATEDFSPRNGNPNGVWSYGWMPADFSLFNNYTSHANSAFNKYAPNGLISWFAELGVDRTPCIWINTGETAYGAPNHWLSLHPGPGKEPSVLRWIAPDAGEIQVLGEFLPGDPGKMTVVIRHNSREIWNAEDSGSFDESLIVAAGDTIDFCVHGGYHYGNTPISAIITYKE